jgi:hypothetical protein
MDEAVHGPTRVGEPDYRFLSADIVRNEVDGETTVTVSPCSGDEFRLLPALTEEKQGFMEDAALAAGALALGSTAVEVAVLVDEYDIWCGDEGAGGWRTERRLANIDIGRLGAKIFIEVSQMQYTDVDEGQMPEIRIAAWLQPEESNQTDGKASSPAQPPLSWLVHYVNGVGVNPGCRNWDAPEDVWSALGVAAGLPESSKPEAMLAFIVGAAHKLEALTNVTGVKLSDHPYFEYWPVSNEFGHFAQSTHNEPILGRKAGVSGKISALARRTIKELPQEALELPAKKKARKNKKRKTTA